MSKGRKKSSKMLWVGLFLCVGIMLGCVYGIWSEQREYAIGTETYQAILSDVVAHEDAGSIDLVKNMGEEADADTVALLPRVAVDFDELYRINEQGCGWIYCPDTVIDYPVAQGTDNEYYVNHTFDKKKAKVGAIFLDYRCDRQFQDRNSVLYGHHMRSGAMFASIVGYEKQSYYEAHPILYLYTQQQNYVVKLFAGFVKDASDNKLSFESDEEFLSYVETLKQKSTFAADVEVGKEDRLLTLCTCAYNFKDARYVLIGILEEA